MSYLFIGPAAFIIDMTTLTLQVIYGMSALAGVGMGCVVVSTFNRSQLAVLNNGFKDDIQTYLFMSGRG